MSISGGDYLTIIIRFDLCKLKDYMLGCDEMSDLKTLE